MFQEAFQFCGVVVLFITCMLGLELQVIYFFLLHAYIIDHCKHFVTNCNYLQLELVQRPMVVK
jgi:hypothetical protein